MEHEGFVGQALRVELQDDADTGKGAAGPCACTGKATRASKPMAGARIFMGSPECLINP